MKNQNQGKHVAVRAEDGKWLVVPTKFDRQAGDAMNIDNKAYVVVTDGTYDECVEVMNFQIQRNRAHHRAGRVVTYPKGIHREANVIIEKK